MRVLVIAESYPSSKNLYNLAYIHSRLIHYVKNSIDVQVLSFQAEGPYEYEGISVTNEQSFNAADKVSNYDMVISHAPNLRNHLKFIFGNLSSIKSLLFFIHGHEVLIKKNYYPAPYAFETHKKMKEILNFIYDAFKVKLLGFIFGYLLKKKNVHIVFVSEWMKTEMLKNVGVSRALVESHSSIIHNNIHPVFFEKNYVPQSILGDFVTIRPLDNSKYAIDIVLEIAKSNPDKSFHIYGEGKYFNYFEKPQNIVWHAKYLKQTDIPELLNHYKCAIMPTRLDSQGVTMCEFASYGIPLYTSDLSICREMLGKFKNVRFFSNDNKNGDFTRIEPFNPEDPGTLKRKFDFENTVFKEIELIRNILSKD